MTEEIKIEMCRVKAVRADLVTGIVNITFTAALDSEMLEIHPQLARLASEELPITLTVKEHQMRLPFQLGRDEEGIA